MYAVDKGIQARSRPLTWVNNTSVPVELSFLYSVGGRMRAPVIREICLEFDFNLTGAAATLVAADACQLVSNIVIRDAGGIIYELSGKLTRQLMIHVLGERGSFLADQGGALANTVNSPNYHFELRIPFDREQARDGADTALPLNHLSSGSGSIQIRFGTPPGVTVTSGTVTVVAICHDEVSKELKSRLVRRSIAMTSREDDYQINGSVEWLMITSDPLTTGQDDWTFATYPTIDVPDLEYSAQTVRHLRGEYVRCRMDRSAADPVVVGGPDTIPLVWASKGQRIDKMYDAKSIRIRLPAAPTANAQLLMSYIEDRYPALAAEWLGYDDVNRFIEAANTHGMVKLAGGNLVPHHQLGKIAKRLPFVCPLGA